MLLAAVMHATWNAFVKAGGDRLVIMALAMILASPFCLFGALFVPFPDPASWPYLVASIVIHSAYYGFLIHAYRHGDLSQVYPIARGAAPVLVAAAAWIWAGEALRPREMLGVAVVSLGILSLAWRRGHVLRAGEAGSIAFALLTSVSIALYSVTDGIGVRNAGSAISYILWLFALEGWPLFLYALWRRRGRIGVSFLPNLKIGFGAAAISTLAYGIVIWAMSLGAMAHVVALRETSVVMAAAIGAMALKEPFGLRRIAAAATVAAGAVLLNAG